MGNGSVKSIESQEVRAIIYLTHQTISRELIMDSRMQNTRKKVGWVLESVIAP
jgi:hypothetical protein